MGLSVFTSDACQASSLAHRDDKWALEQEEGPWESHLENQNRSVSIHFPDRGF